MDAMDGISQAIRAASVPDEARRRVEDAKLREAVAGFEAMFINQVLKTMRETISKSELFHGGSSEEIYTSMLDMELSKQMALGGGIGLGRTLMLQLSPGRVKGADAASDVAGPPETGGPGVGPSPSKDEHGLKLLLKQRYGMDTLY